MQLFMPSLVQDFYDQLAIAVATPVPSEDTNRTIARLLSAKVPLPHSNRSLLCNLQEINNKAHCLQTRLDPGF